MRSRLLHLLFPLLCSLLVFGSTEIQAQEASRQRIELRNGQVLVGVIESESTSEVVVLDASGVRTTIPRAQIRSIRPLAEGQFYRTDPNYTRLFFAPTARTLSRGSGRISTYLVLPSVAYGFTGWLDGSVAASIPVSGLNGIISLNAKARVAGNDTRAFAVGASAAFPYGSEVDGDGVAGTFYGVGTFGSSANGLTIGAIGFYGGRSVGDLDAADGIALLGGYEYQLSNSVKFMTENYVFIMDGGNGVVNGVGLRFFGDRLAADLAIVGIGGSSEDFGDYEIIPVPYFGFAYNF